MNKTEQSVQMSTRQHPRRWKPDEIIYLKRLHAREGIAAVASSLKRSVRAVEFKLTQLNLDERKVGRWTREEDAYVRLWYGKKRPRKIGRKLRRSWQSVTGRAVHLGLKEHRMRSWSGEEIRYLERNYLRVGYKELAQYLGRAVGTVNAKLRLLRLRKLHEKKKWTLRERRLVKKYYQKMPKAQLASMLGVEMHVLEKQASHQGVLGDAGRRYTAQELEYIRTHYATMSAESIARKLDRDAAAIRGLAAKRGWKGRKSSETTLTQYQQSFIRDNYRKKRTDDIAYHLDLTRNMVLAYARRVGLVQLMRPFTTREHWYIKAQVGKLPVETIAANIGRGIDAVRDYGRQQGWEFRLRVRHRRS